MNIKYDKKTNIYDYFKYCKTNSNTKGIGIITDKQVIFYYPKEKDDKVEQTSIKLDIEKNIYHDNTIKKESEIIKNDVSLFSYGENLIINLPENILTKSQVSFIEMFLNQVNQFNNQQQNKITIDIYTKDNKKININESKEELYKLINKNITLSDETIIGKTLDDKIIKSNIIYNIDLNKCRNIKETIKSLGLCKLYNEDKYYNSYIKEIFPDVKETTDLIKELQELKINNYKVYDLKYESIYEELKSIIKEVKLSRINEDLTKKERILKGLEKIQNYCQAEKNIKNNEGIIKEIYKDYQELQETIEKYETEIDQIQRELNQKEYNKKIAQEKLSKNTRNIIFELFNVKKNIKLEEIINNYEKEINKINNKKQKKLNQKKPIDDKINTLQDQFKKVTGLDHMPKEYSKIKINTLSINQETINNNVIKIKNRINELKKEIEKIENKKEK